jgi:hypothetical protein
MKATIWKSHLGTIASQGELGKSLNDMPIKRMEMFFAKTSDHGAVLSLFGDLQYRSVNYKSQWRSANTMDDTAF